LHSENPEMVNTYGYRTCE